MNTRPMPHRLLPGMLLALGAITGSALPSAAYASTWPGAAPCNTTLQACIDATADGGVVSIVSNTPIDEDLNLYNRSLRLNAGAGFRPNLASGRWISVTTAPIAGAVDVTLENLSLRNGYVSVAYNGLASGTYTLRGLTLSQDVGGAPTYIRVESNNGSVDAMLYNNRVNGVPRNLNAGLIELSGGDATLNASVFHNRVERTPASGGDGAGIFVDQVLGASGTLKLHANEVRGRYNRAGIWVSEGLFSSTPSTFTARVYNNVAVCDDTAPTGGTGIGFVINNGSINAQAINNTVSRCYYGVLATQWSGATAVDAAITGLVKNNVLVAGNALSLSATVATAVSNDYNLINGSSNVALGTHTVTSPAQLVSDTLPRLRSGSPAIGAADTATLALGLIINSLPTVDADGLRRIKGSGGDVDIGAYEYGDLSFSHTANSTNTLAGSYITAINNPVVNGISSANVISTPNFNAGGGSTSVVNNNAFGIYYFSSVWRLFNEDETTPMPLGAHFNNFSAASGSGSFRHVSTAANSSGWTTRLDDSSVNDLPDRIVLATQNWSAGSGVYNVHPIGVFFFSFGGPGSWLVANIDAATGGDMPLNAGFNIYAQEASPNAFRATSGSGSSNAIILDHPLLNNTPCAQVHTTRIFNGTAVPSNYDVYYDPGQRWRIFSYSSMPAGTQFNVVVDPAQVADCTDRIFANGFQ